MFDLFSLKGQVAVITGATNGIGLGMAKGLAGADIDQIILTYRSEKALEDSTKIIKEVNPEVKIDSVYANFLEGTEEELVQKIFKESMEKSVTGKVNILINNAGINNRIAFSEFPQDKFDEVLRVNLNIPVKLTKLFGNQMLEKGIKGSIVFTASLCSFQGGVDSSAYAITKGGIKLFTASVSNEWCLKGIRVNSIAPGYISTNLTEQIDPEYSKTIINRIPIGRWGNMDDFRGPIVFLCSEAGAYVTGETLVVDGGWLNY